MDSNALFVVFLIGVVFAQGAQVEVEPREVLVLPGSNVTVMCRVGVPLQYCRVEIPGMQPLNLNSKLSNNDVAYYGAGLPAGQCGFRINQVTERNNGMIKCTLGIETEPMESIGMVQLIVAKAPRLPELDLSRGTDSVNIYKINDVLQASCIVKDGRPVANISWYLDNEPLYSNDLSMPTVIDLAKENLQSKVQNLTRVLQASDNGKHLRCVAFHPAYPDGRAETARQLDVKFAPLPQGEIDKFGYIIGEAGLITVVVEANPKPIIEWDIGGERIRERENDHTGRLEAEPIKDMGNGRYDVSLRIAAINKHDTEKTYYLRTYNDMGSTDYTIKISTSPEPEGLELGIGGIIGIIVAILVILLVVFLLVFAKVTGRWCFSEGQDPKNIGESSDTESADVRHQRFPPIKLTQFFKKTKDKGASSDEIEPKRADDEVGTSEDPKEGLVYAELDLVSPTSVKPLVKDDNEKTEYAEIVYTPQDKAT
ncbi:fasciclin-3 isoform X1 [Tribolium madens]|uniref:fasciclin-3 isoform X1 n=1 Tax=Tribolium madens TaxID=41895 RepID=UPI001CF759F8|nr:fasciclin-3 isoform X1 [Tribolium madens]